jgi:hypothetical protein
MKLSRRAALKGLGTMVALPFLDAMRARAQSTPPTRLLFFYVPCGIHMAAFTPSTTGARFALSPMLEGLADVRDHVTVLSGVNNTAAEALGDGGGDHARGTASFITAVHVLKSESRLQNGPSADQIAARALRGRTRLPSLELGCESGSGVGACDTGYSCAYTHNISWASATVPMPKEVNPRAVFDRLFAGADAGLNAEQKELRSRRRLSVLDFVRDDTQRLQQRLGARDNEKLDEYLTGIRELEQSIAETSAAECSFPERPEGPASNPTDYVDQMLRLALLAFQCDLTRVITFMLGNAGSNRSYGFLGFPGGHHEYSHHLGNRDKQRALAAIGRWEVDRLARLAIEMSKVREGDGSLLDNSLMFFSSEIEDGNAHSHQNLPVLLVGKGGGAIRSGRHVRAAAGTEIGDVMLTMLRTVGVEQASFGEYGRRVVGEIL